jgi:hypothetical protein
MGLPREQLASLDCLINLIPSPVLKKESLSGTIIHSTIASVHLRMGLPELAGTELSEAKKLLAKDDNISRAQWQLTYATYLVLTGNSGKASELLFSISTFLDKEGLSRFQWMSLLVEAYLVKSSVALAAVSQLSLFC